MCYNHVGPYQGKDVNNMKALGKKMAVLLTALLVIVNLTGCGALSDLIRSGFDASGYIQGILDCTYKAEYEQYKKLTDATDEEAEAAYESGIEAEAQTFMTWLGVDTDLVSDETVDAIKELYRQVYQKSSYEVKDAVKADTSYLVEVVIDPIDIFHLAWQDLNDFADEFNTRYENGEFDTYTPEEYEKEYDDGILEICNSYIDQCGYLDPVTVTVTVYPDENGLYGISDDDFASLDAQIISYNPTAE